MVLDLGVWASVVVFVAASSIAIPIINRLLKNFVSVKYESRAVKQLFSSIFQAGAWFFVVLVSLNMLGMGELAAAFGAATGFIALGVSYAVKDMIADTIAGVYLAGDEDFNVGQTIEADGNKGEVSEVGLRNSKLKTDDGIQVLSNSTIDQEWKRFEED